MVGQCTNHVVCFALYAQRYSYEAEPYHSRVYQPNRNSSLLEVSCESDTSNMQSCFAHTIAILQTVSCMTFIQNKLYTKLQTELNVALAYHIAFGELHLSQ